MSAGALRGADPRRVRTGRTSATRPNSVPRDRAAPFFTLRRASSPWPRRAPSARAGRRCRTCRRSTPAFWVIAGARRGRGRAGVRHRRPAPLGHRVPVDRLHVRAPARLGPRPGGRGAGGRGRRVVDPAAPRAVAGGVQHRPVRAVVRGGRRSCCRSPAAQRWPVRRSTAGRQRRWRPCRRTSRPPASGSWSTSCSSRPRSGCASAARCVAHAHPDAAPDVLATLGAARPRPAHRGRRQRRARRWSRSCSSRCSPSTTWPGTRPRSSARRCATS